MASRCGNWRRSTPATIATKLHPRPESSRHWQPVDLSDQHARVTAGTSTTPLALLLSNRPRGVKNAVVTVLSADRLDGLDGRCAGPNARACQSQGDPIAPSVVSERNPVMRGRRQLR